MIILLLISNNSEKKTKWNTDLLLQHMLVESLYIDQKISIFVILGGRKSRRIWRTYKFFLREICKTGIYKKGVLNSLYAGMKWSLIVHLYTQGNIFQLVVTMGIIGIFTVEKVKLYSAQHPEMWWIALVIMLVSIISLACCEGVRRKTPHNFIFLGLFTLAEGFMLGAVTSTYRADEVLMAVGVCAAITLALTVFAFQTKIDFTAMGGKLYI